MVAVIVPYYTDKNEKRHKEVLSAIAKNIANPCIDLVYLVTEETEEPNIRGNKISVIHTEKRPTYNDLFYIADSTEADIKIICNTDIWFEKEAIELIKCSLHKDVVYALSRWDNRGGKYHHYNHRDSQDAWIFKGEIRDVNGDFMLGMPGCDNRIAYELTAAGYTVLNPSKTIRSIHEHQCGIRNYVRDEKSIVPKPYYFPDPQFLFEDRYLKNAPMVKNMASGTVVMGDEVQYDYWAQLNTMHDLLRTKSFNTDKLWTICIPTMISRRASFKKLRNELVKQIAECNANDKVEILEYEDNGMIPIGWKRNWLNINAAGKYISHFDDDDTPAGDYVESILEALGEDGNGLDVVTFNSAVYYDGNYYHPIYYHIDNNTDHTKTDENGKVERFMRPSHLCVIRREITLMHPFKVFNKQGAKNRKERGDNGSDIEFALDMFKNRSLKKAHHIDKTLYHYYYVQNK